MFPKRSDKHLRRTPDVKLWLLRQEAICPTPERTCLVGWGCSWPCEPGSWEGPTPSFRTQYPFHSWPQWSAVGPFVINLAAIRGIVTVLVWLGKCPCVASGSVLSDWSSSLWGPFSTTLCPLSSWVYLVSERWSVGIRGYMFDLLRYKDQKNNSLSGAAPPAPVSVPEH